MLERGENRDKLYWEKGKGMAAMIAKRVARLAREGEGGRKLL